MQTNHEIRPFQIVVNAVKTIKQSSRIKGGRGRERLRSALYGNEEAEESVPFHPKT